MIRVALRRLFGIEGGSLVIAEDIAKGILMRPAVAIPLETYTLERRAERSCSRTPWTKRTTPAPKKTFAR